MARGLTPGPSLHLGDKMPYPRSNTAGRVFYNHESQEFEALQIGRFYDANLPIVLQHPGAFQMSPPRVAPDGVNEHTKRRMAVELGLGDGAVGDGA